MLKTCIEKLMRHENLDSITCEDALNQMLSSDLNAEQASAFLVLLRSKKETNEELTGLLAALQNNMIALQLNQRVMDIVGTGGDGANTINISTGSALLAASCGAIIAKHGNRAVSSQCGSADVLEELGVAINIDHQKINRCMREVGFSFLYSPNFHPQIKNLRSLRTKLSVPTSINMLGPLVNPARPEHVLLGVSDKKLLPLFALQLKNRGTSRSIIAHGNGLDEISCVGETTLFQVTQNSIEETAITPEQFGLQRCDINDLRGGNSYENAALLRKTFHGIRSRQLDAIAQTFILNAAVALYLYGIYSSIDEGISHAHHNLYSGEVVRLLRKLVECSND